MNVDLYVLFYLAAFMSNSTLIETGHTFDGPCGTCLRVIKTSSLLLIIIRETKQCEINANFVHQQFSMLRNKLCTMLSVALACPLVVHGASSD